MQEICLIILEYKPESALDEAYKNGKHLPFIRRIITNQYCSNTSPFWTKYRKRQSMQVEINEELLHIEEEEDWRND